MRVEKNIFENQAISFDSSMQEHLAWLHRHVLSKSYIAQPPVEEIARPIHGTADMARVALLSKCILEYYRYHHDHEALKLSERDLKILQITAAWHDSGRENDGKDFWDSDSAVNLFNYLTLTLGITIDEAKLYAEAIFNKDNDENFYALTFDENGHALWVRTERKEKNILEKILHDADSLDIIRARGLPDATMLDLYKDYVTLKKDHRFSPNTILSEIGKLRNEVSSLIETAGDGWGRLDFEKKKQYESENAYPLTEKELELEYMDILPKLYHHGKLLNEKELIALELINTTITYDPDLNNQSEENFQAAMLSCKLLARGVPVPSNSMKKRNPDQSIETATEIELRKILRRRGVPTRTEKADRIEKHGNIRRSASLIGYAGGVFASSGWLIRINDESMIKSVFSKDSGTGFGKAKNKFLQQADSLSNIKEDLNTLFNKLKLGGSGTVYTSQEYADLHTELIVDLDHIDAIYFTEDPVHFNQFTLKNHGQPPHPASPILQAIFLQNTYEQKTGKHLPIFEYSRIHGFIKKRSYSEDDILKLWRSVTEFYLNKQLNSADGNSIANLTLDQIKTLAVYTMIDNNYNVVHKVYDQTLPADSNYPSVLKDKVNKIVDDVRAKILTAYQDRKEKEFATNKMSILSIDALKYFSTHPDFSNNPDTLDLIKQQIQSIISHSKNLFDDIYETIHDLFSIKNLFKIPSYAIANLDTNYYSLSGIKYNPDFMQLLITNPLIASFFIAKGLNFEDVQNHINNVFVSTFKDITTAFTLSGNIKQDKQFLKKLDFEEIASLRIIAHLFIKDEVIKAEFNNKLQIIVNTWVNYMQVLKAQHFPIDIHEIFKLDDMGLLTNEQIHQLLTDARLEKDDVLTFINFASSIQLDEKMIANAIKKTFITPEGHYDIRFTNTGVENLQEMYFTLANNAFRIHLLDDQQFFKDLTKVTYGRSIKEQSDFTIKWIEHLQGLFPDRKFPNPKLDVIKEIIHEKLRYLSNPATYNILQVREMLSNIVDFERQLKDKDYYIMPNEIIVSIGRLIELAESRKYSSKELPDLIFQARNILKAHSNVQVSLQTESLFKVKPKKDDEPPPPPDDRPIFEF